MDAFESLISMMLRHQGYWTTTSFRVLLDKAEKREIGRASSPRWELDVVAYKGRGNEVLAVECKSFLDSRGVVFRGGAFEPAERYKLFTDPVLRTAVLRRLGMQLQESGACADSPSIRLCLASGKIARETNRTALKAHFDANGWLLFDETWVKERLADASRSGYENDVAFVVSKLLLRGIGEAPARSIDAGRTVLHRLKCDRSKFDVVVCGVRHEALPKRHAIYLAVKGLWLRGHRAIEIEAAHPLRRRHLFLDVAGEVNAAEFLRSADADARSRARLFEAKRWFCDQAELLVADGRTYALTNQWGTDSELFLQSLVNKFPDAGVAVTKRP